MAKKLRAQDLEGLSLPELEILFDRELVESDRLQAESDCLSRRSVESLFRAGRVLAAIRDRLKSQGKWTEWQKEHKVGVTQRRSRIPSTLKVSHVRIIT